MTHAPQHSLQWYLQLPRHRPKKRSQVVFCFPLIKKKKIFTYLTELGFSYGMQDL